MNPLQIIISILAIVVPILMTAIFALLNKAIGETIGRVNDRVTVVQDDLKEHKDKCDKIEKAALDARLTALETAAARK